MNKINSSWEKINKESSTIYNCPVENKTLNRVIIDSQYGMDTVRLIGTSIKPLFEEIKNKIEHKYTKPLGDVKLVNNEIWICLRIIHEEKPGDVKPLLDKIYAVVQIALPIFSELVPEITKDLNTLSAKRGIDYLNSFSTTLINDSSIVHLKHREEIEVHTDYDSNCYASGVNHIRTKVKILEIAFKNKVDAESFLQKLLDQNKGRLLPHRVKFLPNSNTIEVRGYSSQETRYTKASEESEQFIQTLNFLCENQPSLRDTIMNFAKNNFNFF